MAAPEGMDEDEARYIESATQERRTFDALLRSPIRTLVAVRPPVCVPVGASARDAIAAMYESGVGSTLVVDDAGALVGIFTERDVVARFVAPGDDADDVTVRALMTPAPEALRGDYPVAHAFNRIGARQEFRHVPVVGADGRPSGMLSARDLVALVVDALPGLLVNLPTDPPPAADDRFGG